MTYEQARIIDEAVDDAIHAVSPGTDKNVADWVLTNRYPSFPQDVKDLFLDGGLMAVFGHVTHKAMTLAFGVIAVSE